MTPEARTFVRWALGGRDLGPIRRALGPSGLAVFFVGESAPETMRAAPWWRDGVACWYLTREEWHEHCGDVPEGSAIVVTSDYAWAFPTVDALALAVGLEAPEEGTPN